MNYIENLAHLITIRNFIAGSIENLNIRLAREEVKNAQSRITLLDRTIIQSVLSQDFVDNMTVKNSLPDKQYSSTDQEFQELLAKLVEQQKEQSKINEVISEETLAP